MVEIPAGRAKPLLESRHLYTGHHFKVLQAWCIRNSGTSNSIETHWTNEYYDYLGDAWPMSGPIVMPRMSPDIFFAFIAPTFTCAAVSFSFFSVA